MIAFQYNKTSLQHLEKQLKMRQRTLPIIKSKESALRIEVKKCKDEMELHDEEYARLLEQYRDLFVLWNEFNPSLVKTGKLTIERKKVAGVMVPVLEDADFVVAPYSLFSSPKWYADGIELLKKMAMTAIRRDLLNRKLRLLEVARKKTTQKVNLFEKVQIPGYQDAIRKIKRFMEDEENLSKSSQKILKSLLEQREEVTV
ncbi:MAG: V-type ATP synthase subunit D [Bacteroidaceae bacterium]|nr:V-type ATP synthase subunit D [Bacteroidaceae bacterium]